MQMWNVFKMFLVLCVWSLRKINYDFSLVKNFVKIYRYVPCGYCVALDFICFWDVENSKGQS